MTRQGDWDHCMNFIFDVFIMLQTYWPDKGIETQIYLEYTKQSLYYLGYKPIDPTRGLRLIIFVHLFYLKLQTYWPDKGIETHTLLYYLQLWVCYKPIDPTRGLRLNGINNNIFFMLQTYWPDKGIETPLNPLALFISAASYKPIDPTRGLRLRKFYKHLYLFCVTNLLTRQGDWDLIPFHNVF